MILRNPSLRRLAVIAACCITTMTGTALANSHMKDAKAASKPVAKTAAEKMGKTDPAHDAMAEAMAKLAKPGDKHAWMKRCEGTWKTEVKSWYAPGEPAVSHGTAEMKMILGGRYLEQRFKGSMMDQPYEGVGLQGYDNGKQKFWSTWSDDMSTGVLVSEGTLDESGKVLTFTAKGPAPDGTMVDYRMTSQFVDDKSFVFTMFGTMGAQEMKMMEITYTRM